jgi:hypothetical protein
MASRSNRDWAPGDPLPEGKLSFGVQLGVGFLSFFVVLGLATMGGFVTENAAVFFALTLIGFFAVGLSARAKHYGRGVLFGVLIALGLCLLSAGLCLATFSLGPMN